MCDKRPMELADTAEMMMSKDYKERFIAVLEARAVMENVELQEV